MGTQEPEVHDHRRILASLEHAGGAARAPARQRQKQLGIGALILLSLAGLLAWLGYRSAMAPEPDQATPALDAAAPADPAVSAAQQTQPEAAPATIVSDSALAPPHTPHTPRQPAHLAAIVPAAAAAKATTPTQAPAAARPAPPLAVAAESPRPAGDSDVTLLSALVAHAKQQPQEAAAVSGAGPDVVLRSARDSTTTLLQRCEQLSAVEAMLCRSRICAGPGDTDPACR